MSDGSASGSGPSRLVRVTLRNRRGPVHFTVQTAPGFRTLVLGWVGQVTDDGPLIELHQETSETVVQPTDRRWEGSVELQTGKVILYVDESDRPFVVSLEYRVHPGEFVQLEASASEHGAYHVEQLTDWGSLGSSDLPESLGADRREAARLAMDQLDQLVGVDEVNQLVREIVQAESGRQRRDAAGLANAPTSRHLILTGASGTGKTEVARLLGMLLWGFNLVEQPTFVEVGPSELIARYVGGTGPLVDEVVQRAVGGVLFIDEAHMLHQTVSYGQEAVTALLRNMENHRGDLVVIAAGYPDKMDDFLNSDPGLKQRFTRRLALPDYDDESLGEMFRRRATSSDYDVTDEVIRAVVHHFNQLARGPTFANAREARNLFESACERQAVRVALMENPSLSQMRGLELDDILPKGQRYNVHASESALDETLAALDTMVGLDSVKDQVDTLIKVARMNRWRVAGGLNEADVARHFVFSGPPGTGKTTVAEHLASAFLALGVLGRGHVVKASGSDLNARRGYPIDLAAPEIIRSALDGILFIDEAYSLIGTPAIVPLLELMEEHRTRLVVIAAGYKPDMEAFLDSNAGLRSRFTKFIEFAEYSVEELVQIFRVTAHGEGFDVSDEVLVAVGDELRRVDRRQLGNARGVRTMYERAVERVALRLGDRPTLAEMSTIRIEDVEGLGEMVSRPRRVGFAP